MIHSRPYTHIRCMLMLMSIQLSISAQCVRVTCISMSCKLRTKWSSSHLISPNAYIIAVYNCIAKWKKLQTRRRSGGKENEVTNWVQTSSVSISTAKQQPRHHGRRPQRRQQQQQPCQRKQLYNINSNCMYSSSKYKKSRRKRRRRRK